jgi:hypothetical protein
VPPSSVLCPQERIGQPTSLFIVVALCKRLVQKKQTRQELEQSSLPSQKKTNKQTNKARMQQPSIALSPPLSSFPNNMFVTPQNTGAGHADLSPLRAWLVVLLISIQYPVFSSSRQIFPPHPVGTSDVVFFLSCLIMLERKRK